FLLMRCSCSCFVLFRGVMGAKWEQVVRVASETLFRPQDLVVELGPKNACRRTATGRLPCIEPYPSLSGCSLACRQSNRPSSSSGMKFWRRTPHGGSQPLAESLRGAAHRLDPA